MQRSGMASSSVPQVELNAHEEAGETSNCQFEGPGVLTVSECGLKPKHKVFLCHSGAQKDFVEQLCVDLERSDRYPFFDKLRNSLPIGEKFSKPIFDAIKQCQVGVVVLSEEFFTRSKWPMLELIAMVNEYKKPNSRMKIIPLLYRISRVQIKNPFYLELWSYVWEEWAANDRKIDVREWKKAMRTLGSINGLVMKEGMGDVGFREEIILEICRLIPPELQWRDSGGKRRIQEVPGRVSPVMQRSGMASSSVPQVELSAHEEAGETSNCQFEGPGVLTVSECGLKPKHKVFLCHSGAQKDFVEQLCVDLERSDRYPFFDKLRNSLPIGEKFSKPIFDAIKQCQVGVVVLSEEFFRKSKWPMLELIAMVEEFEKPNSRMRIIPLFYCISVARFMDLFYGKRWPHEWEEWAASDRRIDVGEWKKAMRTLGSINGLVMKEGMGDVKFRKEIVEEICKMIPPETIWDDSHVQGRHHSFLNPFKSSNFSKSSNLSKVSWLIVVSLVNAFLNNFILSPCPSSTWHTLSWNLGESSLHKTLQIVVLPIPPTPYRPTTQTPLELEDTSSILSHITYSPHEEAKTSIHTQAIHELHESLKNTQKLS